MEYFNEENTQGYSESDLEKMNQALEAAMADYDTEDAYYDSILKAEAEKIMAELN